MDAVTKDHFQSTRAANIFQIPRVPIADVFVTKGAVQITIDSTIFARDGDEGSDVVITWVGLAERLIDGHLRWTSFGFREKEKNIQ